MIVSLEDVRSWGLKASEDLYLVRFKMYREDTLKLRLVDSLD